MRCLLQISGQVWWWKNLENQLAIGSYWQEYSDTFMSHRGQWPVFYSVRFTHKEQNINAWHSIATSTVCSAHTVGLWRFHPLERYKHSDQRLASCCTLSMCSTVNNKIWWHLCLFVCKMSNHGQHHPSPPFQRPFSGKPGMAGFPWSSTSTCSRR